MPPRNQAQTQSPLKHTIALAGSQVTASQEERKKQNLQAVPQGPWRVRMPRLIHTTPTSPGGKLRPEPGAQFSGPTDQRCLGVPWSWAHTGYLCHYRPPWHHYLLQHIIFLGGLERAGRGQGLGPSLQVIPSDPQCYLHKPVSQRHWEDRWMIKPAGKNEEEA